MFLTIYNEFDMVFKLDGLSQETTKSPLSCCIDKKALIQDLLDKLHQIPYEFLSTDHDQDILEVASKLKDDLEIDFSAPLISTKDLKAALIKASENSSIKQPPFLNPAMSVCNLFDLASKMQESKKKEHFTDLQNINTDLDLLSKCLGAFQTQKAGKPIDFSTSADIKELIDQVKTKWGFPEGTSCYTWENKNEVTSFLTQKTKELTHRSSETMLHLQHQADQLKSMVDITKNMLDEDAKLKETILRKIQG